MADAMPSHDVNTPYWPYSDVVNRRVKMGVVITDMPRCKNEQNRNHNDAFTGTGSERYLPLIFVSKLPAAFRHHVRFAWASQNVEGGERAHEQ